MAQVTSTACRLLEADSRSRPPVPDGDTRIREAGRAFRADPARRTAARISRGHRALRVIPATEDPLQFQLGRVRRNRSSQLGEEKRVRSICIDVNCG